MDHGGYKSLYEYREGEGLEEAKKTNTIGEKKGEGPYCYMCIYVVSRG